VLLRLPQGAEEPTPHHSIPRPSIGFSLVEPEKIYILNNEQIDEREGKYYSSDVIQSESVLMKRILPLLRSKSLSFGRCRRRITTFSLIPEHDI
jgi:hypothetical protein